jgi:presenilin-like A22 family membrane protease
MKRNVFVMLGVIFLLTQALGLFVGSHLIQNEIHARGIISDDPEDVANSVGLFFYILFFTALLLIVIKFFKKFSGILLRAIETVAVFAASLIVFSAFSDSVIIFVPALALVFLRLFYSKNILIRNISTVIAVSGAGALLGVSLGVLPVLVFIIILSVYDFVAVFKTKHMITLAKEISSKNLSFMYAIPSHERTFELGAGDLVVPLVFAVSVLSKYSETSSFPMNFFPSLAILVASFAGLLFTIHYCAKNPGKGLPALPLQTALMISAFIVISFLF